jgi:hypothetical protein
VLSEGTMAWRNEGRLAIVVHGPRSPSNLEWARYLKDFRETPADVRVLVYSLGGGPDGAQRAELTEILKHRKMPAVILTRSAIIRAVGAALSWFNHGLKILGYEAHEAAFVHLGLSADERERAIVLRRELEAAVGSATEVA